MEFNVSVILTSDEVVMAIKQYAIFGLKLPGAEIVAEDMHVNFFGGAVDGFQAKINLSKRTL
jgi:hypothetical protein